VAHSPASSNAVDQVRVEYDHLSQHGAQQGGRGRPRSQYEVEQIAFDFDAASAAAVVPASSGDELSVEDRVRMAASDYQLQMQAYALAVSELMPELRQPGFSIISTLHFLDPNVEFHLDAELLSPDACVRAIDAAMVDIISSGEPAQFPVRTAAHCRMCNFLGICPAGREWVRARRRAGVESGDSFKAAEAGR